MGAIAACAQPEHAARLLDAAGKLCEVAQYALPHAEQLDYNGVAAAVKRALGETAYARAIAEGSVMPLEHAVERASTPMPNTESADRSEPARRRAAQKRRLLLTSREREVAALVAQGLTNREIASRFVITEKTVDAHVQNILNKLGARSRTQIALWAAEQGTGKPLSG